MCMTQQGLDLLLTYCHPNLGYFGFQDKQNTAEIYRRSREELRMSLPTIRRTIGWIRKIQSEPLEVTRERMWTKYDSRWNEDFQGSCSYWYALTAGMELQEQVSNGQFIVAALFTCLHPLQVTRHPQETASLLM